MNGSNIALDTNEAIAVLNNAGDAGQWIAAFTVVYLPVSVVGELRSIRDGHTRIASASRRWVPLLCEQCL